MSLDITYYTGADGVTGQALGFQITRATVSLTGSSATCGSVPPNAKIARITAGEATVLSNNGAAASATNGQLIGASAIVDIVVPTGGNPFYAKTA